LMAITDTTDVIYLTFCMKRHHKHPYAFYAIFLHYQL
jgi:hypothetical protein